MAKENKSTPLALKELEERLEFAGWGGGDGGDQGETCDTGGCDSPEIPIEIDPNL